MTNINEDPTKKITSVETQENKVVSPENRENASVEQVVEKTEQVIVSTEQQVSEKNKVIAENVKNYFNANEADITSAEDVTKKTNEGVLQAKNEATAEILEVEKESMNQNLEKIKLEARETFEQILNNIVSARDFNIIELGLKNSEKGYSFSRPGRAEGFSEMDPFSLRAKLSELSISPQLIESFDDVMVQLSEQKSIPWGDLKEAFYKKIKEKFGNKDQEKEEVPFGE